MNKKHTIKSIKQSVPQCYEPLWNVWRTGRLLWQGNSCVLYELHAPDKEEQRLLLFPMQPAALEQIKIFSCQQDSGVSPLYAYTVFEDCICLRLSALTPASLADDALQTNALQFFSFAKDTFSLLFQLARQEIWLSDFHMEDIAFLADGTPTLFCFHRIQMSENENPPLYTLCKFLSDFCKKVYPASFVYLEQLFAQCGIADICSEPAVHLPPNALLEFYTLLIETSQTLCTEQASILTAITGNPASSLNTGIPESTDIPVSVTASASRKAISRRRRICAVSASLLLMTWLGIVLLSHSVEKQMRHPDTTQSVVCYGRSGRASLSAHMDTPTSASPASPPAASPPGAAPAPSSSSVPASPSASLSSNPPSVEYLDLHGQSLHILPAPTSEASVSTLDCSSNALTSLSGLSEYRGLHELYAGNNRITNLETVCSQRKLQVLLLQNNLLTDILPLRDLSALEHLDLSGNSTLQDIHVLFSMPSLKFINLLDTDVSEKDLAHLRKTLPDCQILPEAP